MKKILSAIFTFFLFLPQKAQAASILPDDSSWTEKIKSGEFTLEDIIELILNITQTLFTLGGIVAVIMVMIGGYYYIIGSITDDKDKAKNIIKYALMGFSLMVFAWLIVEFVIRFFISD